MNSINLKVSKTLFLNTKKHHCEQDQKLEMKGNFQMKGYHKLTKKGEKQITQIATTTA